MRSQNFAVGAIGGGGQIPPFTGPGRAWPSNVFFFSVRFEVKNNAVHCVKTHTNFYSVAEKNGNSKKMDITLHAFV